MSTIRSSLIRLAYTGSPDLQRHLLSILASTERQADAPGMSKGEEETKAPAGGSGGRASGKFIEFMKEVGDKQVHNPDTGNQVKMKSLRGPRGKELLRREFKKWLEEQKPTPKPKKAPKAEEPKKPETPKSSEPYEGSLFDHPEPEAPKKVSPKIPKVDLKVDRYAKSALNATPHDLSSSVVSAFSKTKPLTSSGMADILGTPVLTNSGGKYDTHVDYGLVMVSGPHITHMRRALKIDSKTGDPYIYNDTLVLASNAPKGLGTKIFANQVANAKEHGVKYIKCEAFRNRMSSMWVGYKVWPKLGYDGEIPLNGERTDNGAPMSEESIKDFHKTMAPKIKAAGFKEPYMVSHLLMVDGGADWWDEHGESFDAKFDLTEGSHSMQTLAAYLAEKAKAENTTPEAWISKMGASVPKSEKPEVPKKKDQHENLDLDEKDHKALDAVWKRLREQRQKSHGK